MLHVVVGSMFTCLNFTECLIRLGSTLLPFSWTVISSAVLNESREFSMHMFAPRPPPLLHFRGKKVGKLAHSREVRSRLQSWEAGIPQNWHSCVFDALWRTHNPDGRHTTSALCWAPLHSTEL